MTDKCQAESECFCCATGARRYLVSASESRPVSQAETSHQPWGSGDKLWPGPGPGLTRGHSQLGGGQGGHTGLTPLSPAHEVT